MGKTWSDAAVRNLTNWAVCPRCDWTPLDGGWCPRCDADLNSPEALELAGASRAAVQALEARQAILDRLPSAKRAAFVPAAPAVATPAYAAPVAPRPVVERSESQVSVQSVLAVAGAGVGVMAADFFANHLD